MRTITIQLDEDLVRRAEEAAARRGQTLSALVTRFIEGLAALKDEPEDKSAVLRRLIGILPPDTDESDYDRHIEERYGP